MKKQLIALLVATSIITIIQEGNSLYAQAPANGSIVATGGGAYTTNASPRYLPEDVGMSSKTLSRIDLIVKRSIKARVFPGCQVLVMKDGKLIYDKCFGRYSYDDAQKVKPTSMYDLASLSKTTGTLLAIMKLYDNGQLKLTDRASVYLPFLKGTDKEDITIEELLFHESGLPASLPFYSLALRKKGTPPLLASGADTSCCVTHQQNVSPSFRFRHDWVSKIPSPQYPLQVSDSIYVSDSLRTAAMQMIAHTHLRSKTYLYSCVNFILLKEIAEAVSGEPMNVFLEREFYTPMGLNNMSYLPLRTHDRQDIVPTLRKDFLRNGKVQGYVHDPDAAFLGGVSGNAGLFASARDVAKVYQMLLNKGELDGKRYLSQETCRIFTTTTSPSGRRGLGYDKPTPRNPKHSSCSTAAPSAAYGHTGYTGTCCWVDPVNNMVYVFLSNRTYPNDGANKLSKLGIRTKIQEIIYNSMKFSN